MEKTIIAFVLFISCHANAQFKYSLSFDPIGIHSERTTAKIFQLYNVKLSIKSQDDVFFFEFQPGVLLNGFIPHIDFNLGGQYKSFYLKGGVLYYFVISGGGMSGTSVDTGLLPGVSLGIFFTEKHFFEASFNVAFTSIGVGITL